METQRHIYPVGNNRALVLEVDTVSAEELQFADLCLRVTATNPCTIHEFFNRLADMQREQPGKDAGIPDGIIIPTKNDC